MLLARRALQLLLRHIGYELIRYSPADRGINAYHDMTHYIKIKNPVVLDVGANLGESIESLLGSYPSAQVFSFEPSEESFKVLTKKYQYHRSIKLYCEALGSGNYLRYFNDNDLPFMSSFLELGTFGYGNIKAKRLLEIRSVDNFADSEMLNCIDILKIDVQGFEYDILKGCSNYLSEQKIKIILVELTFTDMYHGLPNLEELFKFLYEYNFILGGIYRQHFQKGCLSWADALFVHQTLIH